MPAAPILTVAAVVFDGDGRVLLVRKRGSDIFIQPGGKREPGEPSLDTLRRELREELGVEIDPASARRLGEFEEDAANEPGRRVRAEVFVVAIRGIPQAQAEIEALCWLSPHPPFPPTLARLSAGHVMPAARALLAGA